MMHTPKRPGRPRLDPAQPSIPVHLKLAEHDWILALAAATKRRETIQDLLRRGLRRELQQPK